jgi:hypothetical protein
VPAACAPTRWTILLGCVYGRLTGATRPRPTSATTAAPTPDYDVTNTDRTRFYKTRLGERLHFRRHCSTLAHSRDDEMASLRVCLVCTREHEKEFGKNK